MYRQLQLLKNQFFSDGKEKNNTRKPKVKQFNSNPADCNDIRKLNYTLNGYYLVNGSDFAGRFAVFFCQFKLPPGANKSIITYDELLYFEKNVC